MSNSTGFGDLDAGRAPDSTTPFVDGGVRDGCADLQLTLGSKEPTIMVLVDSSGSMDQTFAGGQSRWNTLKGVLLDGGVISNLQSSVSFSLKLYSNQSGPGCPTLRGNVPYALNNYAAFESTLRPAGTQPDTPTGEAVLGIAGLFEDGGLAASDGLAGLDAGGGQKVILLVTDGDPDYCGNPQANDPPLDPNEQQIAKNISIRAVQTAYRAGIKTYVLAIGDEVQATHQQEVANAGLGHLPDAGAAAPFFRPSNADDLRSQLNEIVQGVRPCKFTLSASVQSGFETQGHVFLNGVELRLNDPNGWALSQPNEVELKGAACTTVKTTTNATLSASFPCGSIVPGSSSSSGGVN